MANSFMDDHGIILLVNYIRSCVKNGHLQFYKDTTLLLECQLKQEVNGKKYRVFEISLKPR